MGYSALFCAVCLCLFLSANGSGVDCSESSGTCVDQSVLLQRRVQITTEVEEEKEDGEKEELDKLPETKQEHLYGPVATSTSILQYFKDWGKGAIDSHLARIVDPDDLATGDELSTLETDTEALSADAAFELFQSAAMETCPEKAALLQQQTKFEVVHSEPADVNGVRHVLLKGRDGKLQYMASHRLPNGEHRAIVTDPPACSITDSVAVLETSNGTTVKGADNASSAGEAAMLLPSDSSVEDCKALFVRTVRENCNKSVDINVLSAERLIIDGVSVHMKAQVCKANTQECHLHHPECDFEVGKKDATLGDLPEEKIGLTATLKLHVRLCDADKQDGVSLSEAEEDAFLLEFAMGENSLYKGFEHVYDHYPVSSALEVEVPKELDFRTKYKSCFPALPRKAAGSETVRNQGACGSCWAFAAATSTMANLCISQNGAHSLKSSTDRFEVSVQNIMSCAADGSRKRGCKGGNMYGFDAVARTWGLTKERDNLYKCGRGNPKKHFETKNKCDKFPWGGQCVARANPNWWWAGAARVNGEAAMKTFLADGQSMYVSMAVHKNFFRIRRNVYMRVAGRKMGGHAMSACGYGVQGGKKYWLLQNSWGSNPRGWGVNGFGKIRRGVNLAGVENNAFAPRAWVTGAKKTIVMQGQFSGQWPPVAGSCINVHRNKLEEMVSPQSGRK